MHIPDGYLGPRTFVSAYAVMVPVWGWASLKVERTLRLRQVPVLAMGAAFSFLVMMFNIPIPGGTTGHAVGAVLVAVLLGPWAAVMAVSMVLVVQALVFGDGGVTAIGANCLTMAVIMPFTGWWIFRLIGAGAPAGSRRRWLAAAVGGYVGLNAAAVAAAFLIGIQPALARDAAGLPLYSPFGLGVSVPVMAAEHLLLFGFVEAAVTGFAVAYLDRMDARFAFDPARASAAGPEPRTKKLWWVLGALALLTPVGLFLPELLGAGSAWGEWGPSEVGELTGHVPAGMAKLADLWSAPLPDYGPTALHAPGTLSMAFWYVASALAGAVILGGLSYGVRWLLFRRSARERST